MKRLGNRSNEIRPLNRTEGTFECEKPPAIPELSESLRWFFSNCQCGNYALGDLVERYRKRVRTGTAILEARNLFYQDIRNSIVLLAAVWVREQVSKKKTFSRKNTPTSTLEDLSDAHLGVGSVDIPVQNFLIAAGVKMEGEPVFETTLTVDGYLKGRVNSPTGTLIVGSQGRVDANIEVALATIHGVVHGDIIARTLELGRQAKIEGNVQCGRLLIEPGALFEGNLQMLKKAPSVIQKR